MTTIITMIILFIITWIVIGVNSSNNDIYPPNYYLNIKPRDFKDTWEYLEMKNKMNKLDYDIKMLERMGGYKTIEKDLTATETMFLINELRRRGELTNKEVIK